MRKRDEQLPRVGVRLLRVLLPGSDLETVLGDFQEVYVATRRRYGSAAARRWFWLQMLALLPRALSENIYWHCTMLKNYLRVAFRTLSRNPIYGLINVVGLSVGLSCCALIMLFVIDEFSYDQFNRNADDVYRLRVERYASGGESELTATSAAPMMPAALSDISQIQSGVRLTQRSYPIRVGDDSFYEENFFWADSTMFDVFSVDFVRGTPKTALTDPYTVVLTEQMAKKYFGDADPIGRVLQVDDMDLTVTGVVRAWPEQSHFSFDFLGSFVTLEAIQGSSSADWNWWALSYHTYFRLVHGGDVAAAQGALREMPSRYIGNEESRSGYRQFLYLQPLTQIHLTSHYRYELEANSRRSYVFVFAAVALFILTIACVNFMNLSTARSAQRAREVGVRKVCGAFKRQLIGQFLGESILISVTALVLALVLIQILLPLFNRLAFKSLSINYLTQWRLTLAMLGGTTVVGVIAGLYPAFVLSRFKPAEAVKGRFASVSHHALLRQGLVVLQFTVSIVLIVGAIIAQRQLGYMRSADLGFNKEQTLVINARQNPVMSRQFEALKKSMRDVPGVSGVTVSSSIPGRTMYTNVAARKKGMTEDGQTFYYLAVDYDYLDAYGLDVVAGRGFSREMGSDDSLAWVLNEAACKALGWQKPEDAVGEEMTRQFGDTRRIVGVVRNFNFQSLQYAVEPIVLFIHPTWYNYASIRLNTDHLKQTLARIEATWHAFSPNRSMESFFLDQDFDRQYRGEERISGVLNAFTAIAILIACLGLFALASFVALQRRKEIGVRKVLGATTSGIAVMLSTSFARLVIVSTLVAVPLSWLAATKWLANFENRISISWDVFVLAGVLALAIALLTVSYQSVRAAMTNPAITLKTE